MVLNLRSYHQLPGSSNLTTKPDMVFRSVYSRTRQHGEPETWLDSVLDDLGEPLMMHEVENKLSGGEDE